MELDKSEKESLKKSVRLFERCVKELIRLEGEGWCAADLASEHLSEFINDLQDAMEECADEKEEE
jgi:hypothetical protein